MNQRLVPSVALALALAAPMAARADVASELQALRQEIETVRNNYEARIQALERRIRAAESVAAAMVPTVGSAATAQSIQPAPVAPAPVSAAGGANSFNPAMSLILSGIYTRTSKDPASYAISGFQLPSSAEVGPGSRGLRLAESELGISASIDPWFQGAAHIALHPDNAVSVEEAYIRTTSLGGGMSLKAGRFYSGVGYLNAQHAHTWDFVDNPLAYQALLGTQYGDDGLQLKWLAPTDLFIEIGAEVGRGRSYPGNDNSRNGAGMIALTAHAGGDLGTSHSWRAGLSVLSAKASDQSLRGFDERGAPIDSAFSGRTRVWIADAVWKWAPQGNATRTSFKLQAEYLRSTRSGTLTFDPSNVSSTGDYRSLQSGWYVQGIYQFMPRWRVGLRTERLDSGAPDFGANASRYAISDHAPGKNSLMVDFNPSEFSRVRLQVAQDRSRQGLSDKQLFLQYQMSLGAHGAHGY